jgi:hypothetical protein
VSRRGQVDISYESADDPSKVRHTTRWLPFLFNLFYPALIAGVILFILSRYISLPIFAELSEYLERGLRVFRSALLRMLQYI